MGPIEGIVKAASAVSPPAQMIVVCGHNEELLKRIEALRAGIKAQQVKAVGFVDNIYELMASADVLISKSGGITVSESLAKGLPMIIISPIIGQETRNSDYLIKERAALRLNTVADLGGVIRDLAAHPPRPVRRDHLGGGTGPRSRGEART